MFEYYCFHAPYLKSEQKIEFQNTRSMHFCYNTVAETDFENLSRIGIFP